jgi:hypothetical protein
MLETVEHCINLSQLPANASKATSGAKNNTTGETFETKTLTTSTTNHDGVRLRADVQCYSRLLESYL